MKRTEISEVGEFSLIDKICSSFEVQNPDYTKKSIGDDAAVLALQDSKNEQIVVSKDILCEGVHFSLVYCPLKHLGYKAVAVNLSDIAAMNATPKQILVGIGISNRFSVEAIEELYKGIELACKRYNVDLVGGDTTSSASGLFISVTVIGVANKERLTYRSGAKENDLICVSGNLGAAYSGLLLLEREKTEFLANPNMQPDFKDFSYTLERQLKPEPRLDIVEALAQNQILPTSMIDISDGLSSELLHICKASDCGCMIYENKIPVDLESCKALNIFNINPTTAALNGGEDYELLFTIAQKDYEKLKKIEDVSIIGHIVEKNQGCMLVPSTGSLIPLTAQGFDGFKTKAM